MNSTAGVVHYFKEHINEWRKEGAVNIRPQALCISLTGEPRKHLAAVKQKSIVTSGFS